MGCRQIPGADLAAPQPAAAKKKNKKGKTLTLTDFLAEDGGSGAPTYIPKPVSWADETDDLDGDGYSELKLLSNSFNYSQIILSISAVRLPREPTNPERLKGFGYAEFEDIDSLFQALSLNEEVCLVVGQDLAPALQRWHCAPQFSHASKYAALSVDGPTQRPKLNLKPRSAPKEEESTAAPAPQSSRAANIFGEARPVDTAAREREVEERLQKEQEKLQRQLEDDKRLERRPRERYPSSRSEDNPERSRTGSESSQSGTAGPPGTTAGTGPTGRRDENKPDGGRDGPKARSGSSAERKDGRKEHEARAAPEPKRLEDSPASVSGVGGPDNVGLTPVGPDNLGVTPEGLDRT
ncbi:UNVERIFIED_CONTAM: hypothetical protein H355_009889 [Colinus virginianus]|nr:hypothetical protein H355_009889 [Colinus virginianus]